MRTKFSPFSLLSLLAVSVATAAPTNTWHWQATPVPRALVFEGVWSEFFQIDPALHLAGVTAKNFYQTDLPDPYPDLQQRSVIVIANAGAQYLEQQQIKDFVANGGGVVVLGGFWAFNCGYYRGCDSCVLGDVLPVTWPTNIDIPGNPAGWPLTRAASATWLTPVDVAAKPMAYYVHNFILKPDAVVQLMAGDKPAIVSSTFGKGRVVAIGLTVNGVTPPGAVAFWNWPGWPQLLAQAIDWAAGARPLVGGAGNSAADALKPLTSSELSDLTLEMKTPSDLIPRALAHPSAEIAQALFEHVLAAAGKSKVTLAQVLPVLLPWAKADWGARLPERMGAQNPNREDRNAALILFGATRSPGATQRLLPVLAQADAKQLDTKLAAIEALGRAGDPAALPALVSAYDAAIRAAQLPNEPPERFGVAEFAGGQAALATEAALALYRLGEPTGLDRVLLMHRNVQLYQRVLHVAGRAKRGGARLQATRELAAKLAALLEKLDRHAEPIPAPQLATFVKTAQSATALADVEWLEAELEGSLTAFPAATWQPLTTAKDGIIARCARAASALKTVPHP